MSRRRAGRAPPPTAAARRSADGCAAMTSGARRLKGVPDTADRLDQRGAVRIELLSQVADVGLQHAAVTPEVVVPYVVEQLGSGHHAARVQHQIAQQAVFGGGELDRSARPCDLTG